MTTCFPRGNRQVPKVCDLARSTILNSLRIVSALRTALVVLTQPQDGTPNDYPLGREHPRNDWHRLLVRPAPPTDMVQLAAKEDRWAAWRHDVSLGNFRCPVRCLCYCPKLQYPHSDSAAGILRFISCELGADSDL